MTTTVMDLALTATAQGTDLDVVEKYGILGLLYIVLAAIGVFLVKVGFDMNKSIQANTGAVQGLVVELRVLVQQNAAQAAEIQRQMTAHTDRAITAFREGLRDVRDDMRGRPNGNG